MNITESCLEKLVTLLNDLAPNSVLSSSYKIYSLDNERKHVVLCPINSHISATITEACIMTENANYRFIAERETLFVCEEKMEEIL